jgi:hypothetical protein
MIVDVDEARPGEVDDGDFATLRAHDKQVAVGAAVRERGGDGLGGVDSRGLDYERILAGRYQEKTHHGDTEARREETRRLHGALITEMARW